MQTNEELIREARREYSRKWRAENRDKVKAAQDRYWLKKATSGNNPDGVEIRSNVQTSTGAIEAED